MHCKTEEKKRKMESIEAKKKKKRTKTYTRAGLLYFCRSICWIYCLFLRRTPPLSYYGLVEKRCGKVGGLLISCYEKVVWYGYRIVALTCWLSMFSNQNVRAFFKCNIICCRVKVQISLISYIFIIMDLYTYVTYTCQYARYSRVTYHSCINENTFFFVLWMVPKL